MPDPTATPDQPARLPWDQLPDEPDAAYARFLAYRGLGPSRTLERAYALHHGEAPNGTESPQVSGQWKRQCVEFRWVERCEAWDVYTLREAGVQAVARLLALIGSMALQTLLRIQSEGLRPESWSDFLATLHAIGQHIPPETISRVAQSPIARE